MKKIGSVDFRDAVATAVKSEIKEQSNCLVPLSPSARHLHLCQGDLEKLFGKGHQLTVLWHISQSGQFVVVEQVTLVTAKGQIERVRVLGPLRSATQVELAKSDCRTLGLEALVRSSGDISGTPGVTLVGPKGKVTLNQGVIVPDRHIHMTPNDALAFGVVDGQAVSLEVSSKRGGRLDSVTVRVSERYQLDCHIDTDDANAFFIEQGNSGTIMGRVVRK